MTERILTAGLPPVCIDFLKEIEYIEDGWDENNKESWVFNFSDFRDFVVRADKFHSPLALRAACARARGRAGFPHGVSTAKHWDCFFRCLWEIHEADKNGEEWVIDETRGLC